MKFVKENYDNGEKHRKNGASTKENNKNESSIKNIYVQMKNEFPFLFHFFGEEFIQLWG